MKLLTINVHSWLEEKQEEKMELLAKVIAEKRYDVIAMQEVNQKIEARLLKGEIREDNFLYQLCKKIEKYTEEKYEYHWSHSHIGFDIYEEGIALLTRHSILEKEDFYCTNSKTIYSISSRKIVKIFLEIEGKEIEFYSCHMNLPDCIEENMEQNIQNILKHSSRNCLKILMGDFNTDAFHDESSYQKILEQGLFDSYTLSKKKDDGVTVYKNISGWENSVEEKRLDYIFLTEQYEVESSYVIFNGKNYPCISDHNGLEVILKIKE